MSWDDERGDLFTRLGIVETGLKEMVSSMHRQKDELNTRITAATNSVRTELSESIAVVGSEVDRMQRQLERNSARLGFIIAIGSFVAAGVLALVIGLLPYMMDGVVPKEGPRVSMPLDQRMQMIIDVVAQMDRADPDLWTSKGLPRIDVIERKLSSRVGYQVKVTEVERRRAAAIVGVMP